MITRELTGTVWLPNGDPFAAATVEARPARRSGVCSDATSIIAGVSIFTVTAGALDAGQSISAPCNYWWTVKDSTGEVIGQFFGGVSDDDPDPISLQQIAQEVADVGATPLVEGSDASLLDFSYVSGVGVLAFDTAVTPPAHVEGQLFWDAADKTLQLDTDIGDVSLQLGQEVVVRVQNNSGALIGNGSAVYVSGAASDRPKIDLADAAAHSTAQVFGLVTEDIAAGDQGYVTCFGLVRDLDTSSFSAGDALYLDPSTPGALTNVAPSAPHHQPFVARCVRSHPSQGIVLVKASEHLNLDDLGDVNGPAPTDGQALVWDDANQYWAPGTIDTSVVDAETYNRSTLIGPQTGPIASVRAATDTDSGIGLELSNVFGSPSSFGMGLIYGGQTFGWMGRNISSSKSLLAVSAEDNDWPTAVQGNDQVYLESSVGLAVLNLKAGGSLAQLSFNSVTGITALTAPGQLNMGAGTEMVLTSGTGDILASLSAGASRFRVRANATPTANIFEVVENDSTELLLVNSAGDTVVRAPLIPRGGSTTYSPDANANTVIGNIDVTGWTTAAQNVLIGDTAFLEAGADARATIIGYGANADSDAVALGWGATASGVSSMALGRGALASGTLGIAIGYGSRCDLAYSIAIGRDADTTKSYQFMIGRSTYPIEEMNFETNGAGLGLSVDGTTYFTFQENGVLTQDLTPSFTGTGGAGQSIFISGNNYSSIGGLGTAQLRECILLIAPDGTSTYQYNVDSAGVGGGCEDMIAIVSGGKSSNGQQNIGTKGVLIGWGAYNTTSLGVSIGKLVGVRGTGGVAIGYATEVSSPYSHSVAIGRQVQVSRANAVHWGSSTYGADAMLFGTSSGYTDFAVDQQDVLRLQDDQQGATGPSTFFHDLTTAPSSAPTSGAVIYSDGGELFARFGSGPNTRVGKKVPVRSVSTSDNVELDDELIEVDATSGAVTLTLPAASTATGLLVRVVKTDSGTNNVIVDGNGAETVAGAANLTWNTQWESYSFICDGSQWVVF